MNNYKGTLELNWVNKDKSLLYEIDEKEGCGIKPTWVDRRDIRVAEPRNLKLIEEHGNPENGNILIRGDNLLALKTLVEMFKDRDEKDKVKCIYIDPPFNTGVAFENYDDNLEHSQWLTMMRDRLVLLKKLLSKDGSIFVHIDDTEQVICECFWIITLITIQRSGTTGHKAINPSPVNVADYVVGYARNKKYWKYKQQYISRGRDTAYNQFIENFEDTFKNWSFIPLRVAFNKKCGTSSANGLKKRFGANFEDELNSFVLENAERVIRFAIPNYKGVSKEAQKLIDISKKEKNKVLRLERENYSDMYFYKGNRILFYKDKIKKINGKKMTGEPLSNLWTDIPYQGIANEGGVIMRKGKKPEALIKRIIEMATSPGETVLDSFLGSGTTTAVAHKMGRRWIGIEIGEHANTLCIPRLKRIISGEDQTGISKEVGWKGGGGFRYYVVGDSLLSDSDMNWNLTFEEVARALFMMFDYSYVDKLMDGVFVGKRKRVGKYVLSIATKNLEIIKGDELDDIVRRMKKKYKDMGELEIYTNKGVGVKEEDLPEGMSIKKIPESVLREYKL